MARDVAQGSSGANRRCRAAYDRWDECASERQGAVSDVVSMQVRERGVAAPRSAVRRPCTANNLLHLVRVYMDKGFVGADGHRAPGRALRAARGQGWARASLKVNHHSLG